MLFVVRLDKQKLSWKVSGEVGPVWVCNGKVERP